MAVGLWILPIVPGDRECLPRPHLCVDSSLLWSVERKEIVGLLDTEDEVECNSVPNCGSYYKDQESYCLFLETTAHRVPTCGDTDEGRWLFVCIVEGLAYSFVSYKRTVQADVQ